MSEEFLRKKIQRIKRAQEEAERLLEEKSKELYELNQSLEIQVRERTLEFEKARDEAMAANQAKSQFLANMSHEIRTPLNGMLGFVNLLSKSELNENQQDQVSTIRRSGNLLLQIITDILEFSKIEAGKLDIEHLPFNLQDCIEEVVESMSLDILEKGLELPIYLDDNIPIELIGDESRIRQLLINLIGNATKFTPSGEISVSVRRLALDQVNTCRVQVEVRDTGIGIASLRLKSIFQAFEQADISDTRKYGGTGLGLTISQQILKAMGSELQVESQEGEGSCFSFQLNFEIPDGAKANLEYRKLTSKGMAVILSPNQTLRSNLSERLSSWGQENEILLPEDWSSYQWGALSSSAQLIADAVYISDIKELFTTQPELEKKIELILLTSAAQSIEAKKILEPLEATFLNKPVRRTELFESLERTDSKAKGQSPIPAKPDLSLSKKRHVLLVEDNIVNQQVALAMLEAHQISADVAENGLRATELYDPHQHDLVLMDCQMPVMDGLTATKEIIKRHPDAIVIAMTANAFRKTKEECFEAGMVDFLTKPILDEALAEAIERNRKKVS